MKKKKYGIHIDDHHDRKGRGKYSGISLNMEDERKAKGRKWRRSRGETFLVHGHKIDEQETTSENEQCAEDEAFIVSGRAKPKLYKRTQTRKKIFKWAMLIIFALGLVLALQEIRTQPLMIQGVSMEPTITPSDVIFVNWFIFHFREPRPGDVIIFKPPAAAGDGSNTANKVTFIKRVIAVEGDTVEIHGGVVYVNNVRLNEPYIMAPSNYALPTEKVPPGALFVMGDNRRNSEDSHVWGFLPKKNVLSKVDFIILPFNRIGTVR